MVLVDIFAGRDTPRYLIQATISNNCVTAFKIKGGALGSKHNSNPPFKGHGDSESAIKSDLFEGLQPFSGQNIPKSNDMTSLRLFHSAE